MTWQSVAKGLQVRGTATIVPVLSSEGVKPPFWVHHSDAIGASLQAVAIDNPLVLVAHSGAGPLLPAARTRVTRQIAGYIFADAGVPGPDAATCFDLFGSREVVEQWRARAEDGSLPVWTELAGLANADLQKLIPNPALRRQFVNGSADGGKPGCIQKPNNAARAEQRYGAEKKKNSAKTCACERRDPARSKRLPSRR